MASARALSALRFWASNSARISSMSRSSAACAASAACIRRSLLCSTSSWNTCAARQSDGKSERGKGERRERERERRMR
eukprot:1957240-Rhodomonas_salina.1